MPTALGVRAGRHLLSRPRRCKQRNRYGLFAGEAMVPVSSPQLASLAELKELVLISREPRAVVAPTLELVA
eukprot:6238235-Prymnesium_polylepis.1